MYLKKELDSYRYLFFPVHLMYMDSLDAHIKGMCNLIYQNPLNRASNYRYRLLNNETGLYSTYTLSNGDVVNEYYKDDPEVNGTDADLPKRNVYKVTRTNGSIYYFTDYYPNPKEELLYFFKSFSANNVVPMVRRDDNETGYLPANVNSYKLVESGASPDILDDFVFPVSGYQTKGIDCLADLMAYTYKFKFDLTTLSYNLLTTDADILKGFKLPMFKYMVRSFCMTDTFDLEKLIAFTLQKISPALSSTETNMLSNILGLQINPQDLVASNNKFKIFSELYKRYNMGTVFNSMLDIRKDPMFMYYKYTLIGRGTA